MLTSLHASITLPVLLLPLLLSLVLQLLIQVPSLRHEGLTRLLATRDPTQQQALMGLYYPLLQLVVGQGDVGLVADMVEDISDSLAAAPADAAAGAAGQGPAAPAAASGGGGGGGAGLAAGAGSAVELPNVGDNFRAARVHLLQLLRQVRGAGGRGWHPRWEVWERRGREGRRRVNGRNAPAVGPACNQMCLEWDVRVGGWVPVLTLPVALPWHLGFNQVGVVSLPSVVGQGVCIAMPARVLLAS